MTKSSNELSREEFNHRAKYLVDVQPEFLDELYPIVRDLLIMAEEVNRFALAVDKKLDINTLSETTSGEG